LDRTNNTSDAEINIAILLFLSTNNVHIGELKRALLSEYERTVYNIFSEFDEYYREYLFLLILDELRVLAFKVADKNENLVGVEDLGYILYMIGKMSLSQDQNIAHPFELIKKSDVCSEALKETLRCINKVSEYTCEAFSFVESGEFDYYKTAKSLKMIDITVRESMPSLKLIFEEFQSCDELFREVSLKIEDFKNILSLNYDKDGSVVKIKVENITYEIDGNYKKSTIFVDSLYHHLFFCKLFMRENDIKVDIDIISIVKNNKRYRKIWQYNKDEEKIEGYYDESVYANNLREDIRKSLNKKKNDIIKIWENEGSDKNILESIRHLIQLSMKSVVVISDFSEKNIEEEIFVSEIEDFLLGILKKKRGIANG
jgi:hypothetical protein